jgi:hypothetical protein
MNRHLWVAHALYAETHGIEYPGDMCPKCKKWFTRRDNLQKHLSTGRCRSN